MTAAFRVSVLSALACASFFLGGCNATVADNADLRDKTTIIRELRSLEAGGGKIVINDLRIDADNLEVVGIAFEKGPSRDAGSMPQPPQPVWVFFIGADSASRSSVRSLKGRPWFINETTVLIVATDQLVSWSPGTGEFEVVKAFPDRELLRSFLAASCNGRFIAVGATDSSGPGRFVMTLDITTGKVFEYSVDPEGFFSLIADDSGFFALANDQLMHVRTENTGEINRDSMTRLAQGGGDIIGIAKGRPIIMSNDLETIVWNDHVFPWREEPAFSAASGANDSELLRLLTVSGDLIAISKAGDAQTVMNLGVDGSWGGGLSNAVLWQVAPTGKVVLFNSRTGRVEEHQLFE